MLFIIDKYSGVVRKTDVFEMNSHSQRARNLQLERAAPNTVRRVSPSSRILRDANRLLEESADPCLKSPFCVSLRLLLKSIKDFTSQPRQTYKPTGLGCV